MKKTIYFLNNEYWYGGAVNDGYCFPATAETKYAIDLTFNDTYNQINPLFVSSKGRYIWLEQAGKISFDNGVIEIDAEEIEVDESSASLKEAYLKACQKHFAPKGKLLPKRTFYPQLCSWIELFYDQNQESLLKYARDFAAFSEERGIFIVDCGWQMDYGNWEFDVRKFPNPKKFVEDLHALGYLVVPWLAPYISPDSKEFRELEEKKLILLQENGEPMFAHWWDGYSAQIDLSKKEAQDWLNEKVHYLQEEYGFDGMKLDGGDGQFLPKSYKDGNLQNYYWAKSVDAEIKELRACYKLANEPLIQRLADKAHLWNVQRVENENLPTGGFLRYGFSAVVPDILTAGITGYVYACPDMVGGGLWLDFFDKSKLDKELLIRWLQCSILMPMIQFSLSYWNVKEMGIDKKTKEMLALRSKFMPYIYGLIEHAAKTGEPIVRYMEYEFPRQNMEKLVKQFMLGDKYLLAPVQDKGVRSIKITLPQGKWRDYFEGTEYGGGEIDYAVTLDTLPIFEKIG